VWRANGNPNPCTDCHEILHAYPHLCKEGFGAGLTPTPAPILAWRPETLKAEEHIFQNYLQNQKMFSRLQINPDSARYLS